MTEIITGFNYLPAIQPVAEHLSKKWLLPKLEKLFKESKINRALLGDINARFENYLSGMYDKYTVMTPIALENRQRKFEELYVPLTLSMKTSSKQIKYKINDYNDDLFNQYTKILITDTSGMGKSTILKWLFISSINKNKGIPVFFELRKLNPQIDMIDELCNTLGLLDEDVDKDIIIALLKRGDFIFFLDGFDEIPPVIKEKITEKLQNFIKLVPNNLFLISSRIDDALLSFYEFHKFSILPLKLEEAFDLIMKYDRNGETSKRLINKIKEKTTLKNLEEFLVNPFLVSLLYKSYNYKPTIPFKKHIFYRQVYDSLFDVHDLSKGDAYSRKKHTDLDIDDFHRVLRLLGLLSMRQGNIEFDKDTILKLLRECKKRCPGLDFKESDFLTDVVQTVPLFLKEGENYRWAHKSIQEYFTAQYITLDTKTEYENILLKIYESSNVLVYLNILDLCYDMDYKSFRNTLIYKIVSDFAAYCQSTYLKCVGKIPDWQIKARQRLSYKVKMRFIKINSKKILDNLSSLDLDEKNEDAIDAYVDDLVFNEFLMNYTGSLESLIFNSVNLSDMKRFNWIFGIAEVDTSRSVLNMLYSKKEKFVNKFHYEHADKIKFDIIDINIPESKIYLLSEDNNDIFNSNKNFDKTNNLIQFYSTPIGLYYDECLKIKEEIEKEKKDNKVIDDILNIL